MNIFDDPDAIIIGSGAGGGIAALVLAKSGLKTVLFEKGPNRFTGLDNPNGIESTCFSNDELKLIRRYFAKPNPIAEPRTFRPEESAGARTFIGDVQHIANTLGGGTTIYDAVTPRMRPEDFQLKTYYGNIPGSTMEDWPLTYSELEPFYTAVEKIIGVQGDDRDNPWKPPRSEPYPMKPGYRKYVVTKLARAAKNLGYHPYPAPAGINSMAYRGRPACTNCGFCSGYGCAIHAKGSTAVTAIREAVLTGNLELRTECFVYRIVTDSSGIKATGVEYIDRGGERKFQKGKLVILACNAIESARLCLLSESGKHPNGPGNSTGLVGKNLTFHTMVTAGGIFPERMHSHRGRQTVMLIDDFNPSPFRPPLPGAFSTLMGGSTEIAGGLQPIEEASYLPLMGEMHKLFMKLSIAREHAGAMTVFVKDLPQLTNCVDLDPEIKDIYGFPVARITYKLHENDRRSAEFFTTRLKEIMTEAGALLTFIDINNEQLGNGIPSSKHLHGTLRMGNDPSSSVVNKWGKFHDLENLYCVDSSIFPYSTGYNPVLTIMALSFMVCAHIVRPSDPYSVIQDII